MSVSQKSSYSDILRPMDDKFIAEVKSVSEQYPDDDIVQVNDDGTVTLELPTSILDTPTPYESQPDGSVSRMRKTRAFRAFYRATSRLSDLGSKPSLGYGELGQIIVARSLLTYARDQARGNRRTTPELYMRIDVNEALADITAFTGSIIETHDQPRMVEAYEQLFFPGAYEKLLDVGREVMKRRREPNTGKSRAAFNGFSQELVFHLLQYRQQNGLRFSTPASVYDDYFRSDQPFDATAFNLKLGREKAVKAQIKTWPDQLEDRGEEGFRVIYGSTDLHNVQGDIFWHNTLQADRDLPTLSALLDEAAGDTTSSAKLDEITTRLHSRLFS
jgi:hypothetical protein